MTLPVPSYLTNPTTIFCYIDSIRDTVERVWPMRHVDRVKVGSGNTKEDTRGWTNWEIQVEDNFGNTRLCSILSVGAEERKHK